MTIHPHSSAETFFIFCVGTSLVKVAAFKSSMANQSVSIKPLLGSYKGQTEMSFIASMSNYRIIEPWLNMEESILHVHNFDARDIPDATLLFLKTGTKVELGKIRPVDKDVAFSRDSWTYDPIYKTYFITDK